MATTTFLEPGTDATQDFSFWANGTGTTGTAALTSATDQSYTGLRSIKCVLASINDETFAGSPDGVCADAGTRFSFRFRFNAVPASVCGIWEVSTSGGAADTVGLALTSAGKILLGAANSGGGNVGTVLGTTVLSANTWYRITLSYTLTSIDHLNANVYINGALEISTSGTLTGVTTGTSCFFLGADSLFDITGVTGTPVITVWYDNIYVDNGTDLADPGDIRVTAKRPFANGTTNGFSGTGTPSGYGSGNARYVNEQPLNQSNFVSVVAVASAITEEYNIEGLSVGDVDLTGATIKGVMGWAQAKSLLSETGKIVVDGTQSNISLTSTIAMFTQNSATPTVYPAGSGTDIGLVTATTATTITLYEAGVLVAYIAAPPVAQVPYQPQYFLGPAGGY